MKGKIGGIYKALQELDVKPTPSNARILAAVFNTLEEIYTELEDEEHGRTAPDTEPGTESDRAAGQ